MAWIEEVPADIYFPDEETADCFYVCAYQDDPYECYRRCVEALVENDVDDVIEDE